MYTHQDLARLQSQSLKMQGWIRRQTFSPANEKTLRRFSSWEVAELIFGINQSTFRGKLAAEAELRKSGLIPRVGAQVGHPQHQSEGERRHRGAEGREEPHHRCWRRCSFPGWCSWCCR